MVFVNRREIKIVILLFLCCVSCSPSQDIVSHMTPPPSGELLPNEKVCFSVNQMALWETGNEAEELSTHIVSNIKLQFDGVPVASAKISFADLFMLEPVFDDDGNLLGSVGWPIGVCIEHELELGVHRIEVETSTMSGVEYSYSWNFEIIEEMLIVTP